jgi:nucleotide-binding universal stress UspA family protein
MYYLEKKMFDELRVNRILVAIDGSENSIKAADYSLFLANKFDAIIIALYVIPPNVKDNYERQLKAETIQDTFNKIKNNATQYHIELKTDTVLSESSVVTEIVNYAKKEHADLLLIGIRGESEFRFMLGSVASGVVTNADCPVLVVK